MGQFQSKQYNTQGDHNRQGKKQSKVQNTYKYAKTVNPRNQATVQKGKSKNRGNEKKGKQTAINDKAQQEERSVVSL